MKIPIIAAFAVLLGCFSSTEAKDIGFRATINEIIITRQFDSRTIVTGVDPRFLVKLTLHQDVEGIGKSGDSVSFAIHSLSRDLNISDQDKAVGKKMLWEVGRKDEGSMTRLRSTGTDDSGKTEPTDGRTPSENKSE